jgi:hypothetical protein
MPLAGATEAKLTLNDFARANEGDYFVVLSDPFITLTSSVVTVFAGPYFTEQPQSQIVQAGAVVILTATAVGNGPVGYQWRRNGQALEGETANAFVALDVDGASEGSYDVVATDDFRSAPSDPAVVGVIAPIAFVQRPQSQIAGVGDDVTFTVEIAGGPPPFQYIWRRNVSQVRATALRHERMVSFTITNVQLADAGTYLVQVTNDFYAVTSLPAATLTVTNSASARR